jgi:hypothetical protein
MAFSPEHQQTMPERNSAAMIAVTKLWQTLADSGRVEI